MTEGSALAVTVGTQSTQCAPRSAVGIVGQALSASHSTFYSAHKRKPLQEFLQGSVWPASVASAVKLTYSGLQAIRLQLLRKAFGSPPSAPAVHGSSHGKPSACLTGQKVNASKIKNPSR